MNNSKWFTIGLILLTVLVFPFVSCKKEKKSSSLLIKVQYDTDPMKGVHVFTVPRTDDGVTDQYGTIKFEGISGGVYDVYAEVGSISGKTTIVLGDGEIRQVNIDVNYTDPISFLPTLTFTLPDIYCHYAPGDTIVFQAKVTNQKDGAQVVWSSNIQGTLGSSSINADGISDFSTNKLSNKIHTITAKVEGKDGYCTMLTREIAVDGPKKVYLYPMTQLSTSVTLNWSKYKDNDFGSYTVCCRYKSNADDGYIGTSYSATMDNINDTSYIYTLTPSFYSVQFYIQITNSAGITNISNRREIILPFGVVFDGSPIQMIPHPSREMAYLIFNNEIILYDYIHKTKIAEQTVNTSSKFVDINDNGSGLEIYLPDLSTVHVLDANTLATKKDIAFNHEVISVTSSGQGFLICSQKSDADSVRPLKVYSIAQQKFIYEGGTSNSYYYMKKIPGKNALAACTRSGYSSMLDYFEFSNSGEITDSNHIYDASSGFSTDVMEMSPDGQYFAVDTYGYLRKTDRDLTPVTSLDGGYSVDDYTFNSSGSSIYATSQYYNTMLEYHYPSGTVVKNYTLSGEPLHLFYKNGNCIIAENLYDYSSRTFIEIINVSGKGK